MSYLSTIGNAIGDPVAYLGQHFLSILPSIIILAIVILFGYLLGWLLGSLVRHALHKMKFDEKFKSLHIAKPLEKIKISSLIGWVVKWYTFVVFAAAGANYINLYPITDIVTTFAEWFPKLLVAFAIGLAGAVFAEFVYNMILQIHMTEKKVFGNIVKYFILVLVVTLALDQVIDISVLEKAVLIILAGVSLGIALAIGIAFGLALKDEASAWVSKARK